MQANLDEILDREAELKWVSALLAGLMAGLVVWLLSHGTPWFTSGLVSPTLMGRDLKSPGTVDSAASALTVVSQVLVSIVYGILIGWVASHFRHLWALAAGGLVGLVLYLVNLGIFQTLLGTPSAENEVPVIVTHVVFGLIAAAAYRGLAARRRVAAD